MRHGLLPTLIPLLIAAAMGGLIAFMLIPEPDPIYNRVEVPVEVIREVERVDTVVTWKERIVYRTVEARTVAVADSGAVPDVASFCAAAVAAARAEFNREAANDSLAAESLTQPQSPVLLLRSVRVDPGWFWGADRLIATGPRSDASLWQGTYDVRPGWQGHVRGDELLVQSPRFWWVRELLEAGVYFGAGYLAGSL